MPGERVREDHGTKGDRVRGLEDVTNGGPRKLPSSLAIMTVQEKRSPISDARQGGNRGDAGRIEKERKDPNIGSGDKSKAEVIEVCAGTVSFPGRRNSG